MRRARGSRLAYAAACWIRKWQCIRRRKTYRLHLEPPNMPAKQFWSLIPYDTQTRSVLQNISAMPV